MFMVRKMATGSSGDRVCMCVCVMLSDARLLLTTLHREMEQRQYRGCQQAERVRDKAVNVRNMYYILVFASSTNT